MNFMRTFKIEESLHIFKRVRKPPWWKWRSRTGFRQNCEIHEKYIIDFW